MNRKYRKVIRNLYGNTGGERVKDILLIVFGGLLSGSMAIGLLTVQILQAVIGHGGITSTAVTVDWYTGRRGDDLWRLYRTWQIETASRNMYRHLETERIVILNVWQGLWAAV